MAKQQIVACGNRTLTDSNDKFICKCRCKPDFFIQSEAVRGMKISVIVIASRRGGNINKDLLKREAFWIHKFNSLSPTGMNEELDLTVFL